MVHPQMDESLKWLATPVFPPVYVRNAEREEGRFRSRTIDTILCDRRSWNSISPNANLFVVETWIFNSRWFTHWSTYTHLEKRLVKTYFTEAWICASVQSNLCYNGLIYRVFHAFWGLKNQHNFSPRKAIPILNKGLNRSRFAVFLCHQFFGFAFFSLGATGV